jgi:hypothetical protein
MQRIVWLLLCCLPMFAAAQRSDFPKNYMGAFYVIGYYSEVDYSKGYRIENGRDFRTVGLSYSRRLTKNVYAQSNFFAAGKAGVYFDAGVKLNALVYHKLQHQVGLTDGKRFRNSEASLVYYSFGLDYHVVPNIMLQASVFSNVNGYSEGLRFGGVYKF